MPVPSSVSSDSCSGLNRTIYVYPHQKVAEVKLPNGAEATLPIGQYNFKMPYGSDVCTFYVTVVGKIYLPFHQYDILIINAKYNV